MPARTSAAISSSCSVLRAGLAGVTSMAAYPALRAARLTPTEALRSA
jgi:ABC-type antimicrobial peptide transport system permease subunit